MKNFNITYCIYIYISSNLVVSDSLSKLKGSAVLVHINQLFEFSGQILIIIRGYLWMDTIYTSSYIGNQLFWDWDLTVDIFIDKKKKIPLSIVNNNN